MNQPETAMKKIPLIQAFKKADSKGVALLVTMLVLGILSIVGIYAVNVAIVENRIAGNYRSGNDALLWADASIEYWRSFLASTNSHPVNRGGDLCSNSADYMTYPPNSPSPLAFLCIEHLKWENLPTATGYGKIHYYRLTGISMYTDAGGNVVGRREVESVERMLTFTR